MDGTIVNFISEVVPSETSDHKGSRAVPERFVSIAGGGRMVFMQRITQTQRLILAGNGREVFA
jgi:hypothetical protein